MKKKSKEKDVPIVPIEKSSSEQTLVIEKLEKSVKCLKKLTTVCVLSSILCILFSIAAFYCTAHFKISAAGIIAATIAILAILVTILIGWQIYNVIDFKEKQKTQCRLDRIEKDIYDLKEIAHFHQFFLIKDGGGKRGVNIIYPHKPEKNEYHLFYHNEVISETTEKLDTPK